MRREEREVKDMARIREILAACKVCRLGMTDETGHVYIVPMNYGYCFEDDRLTVYFHGACEGKKFELLKKNPKVGVELDCGHDLAAGKLACQYSYRYASIIGNGTAAIVTKPEDKQKALALIMKHQTGKDFAEFETNPKLEKAVTVIRVDVREYSCKQNV